jgi:hypothetical protein
MNVGGSSPRYIGVKEGRLRDLEVLLGIKGKLTNKWPRHVVLPINEIQLIIRLFLYVAFYNSPNKRKVVEHSMLNLD